MKKLFVIAPIAALLAIACAHSAPAGATHAWWHGSITVDNDSSYAVHHIFLTPAHEVHWGPDQLGHDVLDPHETITLAGLDCEQYDLKLVDHEGDECTVEDIDLCLEDAHWHLTDSQLSACSGFSK